MIPVHPRPGRDQRGQAVSSFVAVVLVAIFGVAGLVVDGGARSAAKADAEAAAAHAARAAVDASARHRAAGRPVDLGTVRAAGQAVLAERGLTGTISVVGGSVHVSTSTSVRTVFLGLIGITTLSASGDATAALAA